MNTQDLESDFVSILKNSDKTWFNAAAASLNKQPHEVKFSNLASVPFGEFTAARAGQRAEFLFGVCLPLSVAAKRWTTEQYFNFLKDRSKKKDVNLRLARKRIDPPNFKTTIKIALTSFFLFLLPFLLLFVWRTTDIFTVAVAIFVLFIPTIMSADFLFTHAYYTRLARRIDELHG
ncbi:hypothetical protein ACMU_14455 [Actibacterium mucosum KCTC 23349]|uniref:Uncharacterized protein n=1 Tax=Actibacterium mucosum KCTC 23349 TaxID=1454373 RepID=A0A037ZH79_9RHOB|nr:hypothetical protein [Actibacterium mucosum]KAJ54959.1 hypothetical protein ACMU_14455 [Actibacterium mucosum KCTC 23349]